MIPLVPRRIKKIVFLASGAGDWTALKNRSDEDLSFLAFVDVARAKPEIQFVYRPHPLWMHPNHQGVYSIQRVIEYTVERNLPNLRVSGGALAEGNDFRKNKQLSAASMSIDEDVDMSDLVLGDHSQALITAAQKGRIIASVSLAKRKEFFSDYIQLGFPILRSAEDIMDLIKRVEGDPDFIVRYNKAIELYNDQFS